MQDFYWIMGLMRLTVARSLLSCLEEKNVLRLPTHPDSFCIFNKALMKGIFVQRVGCQLLVDPLKNI